MSALKEQIGGDHYKEMAIQPIEFCQKNRLGYAESLAIKYVCRHGRKHGREDIDKAIHCLELLRDLEYPEAEDDFTTKVRLAAMGLLESSSYCWSCGRQAHGRQYCADCEAMRSEV